MNEKSSSSRSRKLRLTTVGTRCADHVTPLYPQKLALTSPTGGGRSVGIVRVRTKATEISLYMVRKDGKSNLSPQLVYHSVSVVYISPRFRLPLKATASRSI